MTEKTKSLQAGSYGKVVKTAYQLKMDDRSVFSLNGVAYPRRPSRGRWDRDNLRLPFLKSVKAKGNIYNYFNCPIRGISIRIPDWADIGFAHAYLSQLAIMEGGDAPTWDGARTRQTCVYFLGHLDHAIKIGWTVNLKKRLATIQCGSPVPITVLCQISGKLDDERKYHTRFAEHRLHGEWFSPHPEILAEIERIKSLDLEQTA